MNGSAHRRDFVIGRPAACDIAATRSSVCAILGRDGPDAEPGPARAPGSSATVRARGPPAARGRLRDVRRADRPGRRRQRQVEGDRRPTSRRQLPEGGRRPGLVDARAGPRPRAARAGDGWPLGPHPGRIQRPDPLRSPTSAGGISTRACAASATAATRSRRQVPARTPARSKRPRSAMTPRASTCSTARSGSSPGHPTPTS